MKNTLMMVMLLICPLGWAAQITVNSSEFNATSNGNCNFAEAVLSAGFDFVFDQCVKGDGDDVIVFNPLLFPLPLNTLFLQADDTLVVFGDSLDIQVPVGKTLSLNSVGNQPLFIVDLNANSSFALNHAILKNASSTANGGAIQFDEDVDNITLVDVVFENNSSTLFGGAIGFDRDPGSHNVTTLNLNDCEFINNSASDGGAIFADEFIKLNITDCNFINNSATQSGGAVRVNDDLNVDSTVFNGNYAEFGGGVFSTGGVARIENSLFENNLALTAGGGLYKSNFESVTSTILEFRRNSVIGNAASTGAGLYVGYNQLFFINNLIANNVASNGAGGLFNDLASSVDGAHQIRIIGNSFYHNIGQGGGNAVADIYSYFSNNVTTYIGNAVVSQVANNAASKCRFFRVNTLLSKHNLSNEDSDCILGNNNQILADPVAEYEAQTGFHPFKLVPKVTSPLIDAWNRTDCFDQQNVLLDFDLTGRRNHTGLLDIYNGDGDGQGDCDIGSTEIPDAVIVAVGQTGTGAGRIYGNPETAIDCLGPAICEEAIVIGEQVTFNTEAYNGSRFVQWGFDGVACGTSPSCQLTVPDHAITVAAEFELIPTYLLTVSLEGNGGGAVFSTPSEINCGQSCLAQLEENTMITLEASRGNDSIFMGWSGDCSGTGLCELTMDQDKNVTATFNIAYELNVTSGPGGSVSSVGGGIDCPSDCYELYESGSTVTLSATPDTGFVFNGWSGDCSGMADCMFNITSDSQVTASFISDDVIFVNGFESL